MKHKLHDEPLSVLEERGRLVSPTPIPGSPPSIKPPRSGRLEELDIRKLLHTAIAEYDSGSSTVVDLKDIYSASGLRVWWKPSTSFPTLTFHKFTEALKKVIILNELQLVVSSSPASIPLSLLMDSLAQNTSIRSLQVEGALNSTALEELFTKLRSNTTLTSLRLEGEKVESGPQLDNLLLCNTYLTNLIIPAHSFFVAQMGESLSKGANLKKLWLRHTGLTPSEEEENFGALAKVITGRTPLTELTIDINETTNINGVNLLLSGVKGSGIKKLIIRKSPLAELGSVIPGLVEALSDNPQLDSFKVEATCLLLNEARDLFLHALAEKNELTEFGMGSIGCGETFSEVMNSLNNKPSLLNLQLSLRVLWPQPELAETIGSFFLINPQLKHIALECPVDILNSLILQKNIVSLKLKTSINVNPTKEEEISQAAEEPRSLANLLEGYLKTPPTSSFLTARVLQLLDNNPSLIYLSLDVPVLPIEGDIEILQNAITIHPSLYYMGWNKVMNRTEWHFLAEQKLKQDSDIVLTYLEGKAVLTEKITQIAEALNYIITMQPYGTDFLSFQDLQADRAIFLVKSTFEQHLGHSKMGKMIKYLENLGSTPTSSFGTCSSTPETGSNEVEQGEGIFAEGEGVDIGL
jgi:hypothetical protein